MQGTQIMQKKLIIYTVESFTIVTIYSHQNNFITINDQYVNDIQN